MPYLRAFAAILVLLLGFGDPASAQTRGQPGVYDYYVLSLSWSPTYCAHAGAKADPRECGPDAAPGFVLHGLWPQYENGGWPENCPTTAGVPPSIVDAMLEVMPSANLIEHEWTKHGSCSGMTPDDFFAETRAAWERIRIPSALATPGTPIDAPFEALRDAFVEANSLLELPANGMAVVCDGKAVSEVRICLTKDLEFRDCGKGVVDSCKKGDHFQRH